MSNQDYLVKIKDEIFNLSLNHIKSSQYLNTMFFGEFQKKDLYILNDIEPDTFKDYLDLVDDKIDIKKYVDDKTTAVCDTVINDNNTPENLIDTGKNNEDTDNDEDNFPDDDLPIENKTFLNFGWVKLYDLSLYLGSYLCINKIIDNLDILLDVEFVFDFYVKYPHLKNIIDQYIIRNLWKINTNNMLKEKYFSYDLKDHFKKFGLFNIYDQQNYEDQSNIEHYPLTNSNNFPWINDFEYPFQYTAPLCIRCTSSVSVDNRNCKCGQYVCYDSACQPNAIINGQSVNDCLQLVEYINYRKFMGVYFYRVGAGDEDSWIFVAKNTNNQYIFYEASCDYTGFDCQGYIELSVSNDPNNFWNFCLSETVRNLIKSNNNQMSC